MNRLQGKVALVTGGGTGIGRSIALRLAEEGASVAILGREREPLEELAAAIYTMFPIVADITKTEELAHAIGLITDRFGRLDILVNNAGVAPVGAFDESTMDEYDTVFLVNVRGLVDLTSRSLPMLKAARGSVINLTSSIVARPLANMSTYAASKAAVDAYTKVWAKEYAADGVRFNTVSPGPIETPIYDKTALSADGIKAHVERVTAMVPLGRFGKPEEVSAIVAFLASDEAGFVTGADYAVDGGLSV
ncbi:SDR family NAD(P)-dependent oxidoreductase [Ralstonia pseudosolanacearum]|uniref:SDR family NAD(P)-dependent oxidoreductase n=1 Tax=Ralstonia pseudosolanacearum TaxID=1310165 RepID=UPI0038634CB1